MPVISSTSGQRIEVASPNKIIQTVLTTEDQAILVLSGLSNNYRAGIVVNTVNHAQTIYRKIKQDFPQAETILLHSAFAISHRKMLETRLMRMIGKDAPSHDKPIIVVGTQILEQSLDIDFDVMISALAPIENILQRLGRVHRHQRPRPAGTENPYLYVISEPHQGSIAIYGQYALLKSEHLLRQQEIIEYRNLAGILQKSEDLDDFTPTEWLESKKKSEDSIKIRQNKSKSYLLSLQHRNPHKNLFGFITTTERQDDIDGQSVVRDGLFGLPVILIFSTGDDRLYFPHWNNQTKHFERIFLDDQLNTQDLIKALSAECTLPYYLNNLSVITALEKNGSKVKNWFDQSWLLRGHLPLIFTSQTTSQIITEQQKLSFLYDSETGLMPITSEKEHDND